MSSSNSLRLVIRRASRPVEQSSIWLPACTYPVTVQRPRSLSTQHTHRERWTGSRSPPGKVTRLPDPTWFADLVPPKSPESKVDHHVQSHPQQSLPVNCPGCGAHTQLINPDEAGFYTIKRRAVKAFLNPDDADLKQDDNEADIFQRAMHNASPDVLKQLGIDPALPSASPKQMTLDASSSPAVTPICDRCHNLIHQNTGVPIFHPSIESIEDTILESPHARNHIYHIIDAADFPMSVIPDIQQRLSMTRLRTQNRRSKSHHYSKGKETTMSFIITRSDLLAPLKGSVDTMFAKLKEILRDVLKTDGRDVRLGNVHCVSAKRGWWTPELKEQIWSQGGAAWMVGRVNVGKSNLFETVFPKGRTAEGVNLDRLRNEARQSSTSSTGSADALDPINTTLLLPPSQPETQYPVMPIISALSGTTASPIRIPFGQGKGELIDLPGIARRTLESYVQPVRRTELVMRSRVAPERIVIKQGSSLLLGGLICITPRARNERDEVVIMAHNFTPLPRHLTSSLKTAEIMTGARSLPRGLDDFVLPDTPSRMRLAGRYKLSTDVTRGYAGPLTRKDAVGLKPSNLPFVVYATDILIEGCGWVELVAQVRRPRSSRGPQDAFSAAVSYDHDHMPEPPEVEVFSPEGRCIGQRPSLSAWLTSGPQLNMKDGKRGSARPRQSMKHVKRVRVEG